MMNTCLGHTDTHTSSRSKFFVVNFKAVARRGCLKSLMATFLFLSTLVSEVPRPRYRKTQEGQ
jgi:hypothetical protein